MFTFNCVKCCKNSSLPQSVQKSWHVSAVLVKMPLKEDVIHRIEISQLKLYWQSVWRERWKGCNICPYFISKEQIENMLFSINFAKKLKLWITKEVFF